MQKSLQSPHDWPHAEALKRLREREGLGMEAAANRIGAKRASWDKWERMKRPPSQDMLKRIVEEFGCPPALVGYEPPAGWELVPSDWIRQAFQDINARLDALAEDQEAAAGLR